MTSCFESQVTFCYTNDLVGTARFYEEVMELPLALDQGVCRIYRTAPAAYLGFCSREDAPEPNGIILTLVTDDVDEWHARLAARGAVFEKPPGRNERFDIYHCFLRDPNGYLIEIQRFEDPAWPTTGRQSRGPTP